MDYNGGENRTEEKRYCYTCGAVVKVIERIYAYDEYTGKPRTAESIICPNNKWYKIFFSHLTTEADDYAGQAG